MDFAVPSTKQQGEWLVDLYWGPYFDLFQRLDQAQVGRWLVQRSQREELLTGGLEEALEVEREEGQEPTGQGPFTRTVSVISLSF